MKRKAIICDIDNVIVDTSHILKEAEKQPTTVKKWEYFQRHCTDKSLPINYEIVNLLKHLNYFGNKREIIFITARSDVIYRQTKRQLELIFYPTKIKFKLYMRNGEDGLSACEVKREIVERLSERYDFEFAIDDELENCKMFKSCNIKTLQYL